MKELPALSIVVFGLLVYMVLWVLIGGLCTWIAGKILKRDELTYPTSMGLNLLFWAANPLIPFVLFFVDYYIGLPAAVTDLAPAEQSMYISLGSTVINVVLWLALYKYFFGWDFGQSCTFCIAQSCTWAVIVGLIVVLLLSSIAIPSFNRARERALERKQAEEQPITLEQ